MQFSTIPVLAFLATGVLALPSNPEAGVVQARADCSRILPACAGGRVAGQTNCRCSGQQGTCDLWTCPGTGANTVVSLLFSIRPNVLTLPLGGQGILDEYLLMKPPTATDGVRPGGHRLRLDLRDAPGDFRIASDRGRLEDLLG